MASDGLNQTTADPNGKGQSVDKAAVVADFIREQRLPDSFADTVSAWYEPLAAELALEVKQRRLSLLGVSGCQGSGKSTLAAFLVAALRAQGLSVVSLSLDDFYLTRFEREQLAKRVHPLLITRGVPGTHDVALGIATIQTLRRKGTVAIPRFDKAADDRFPEEQWESVTAPVDLIILEGWCVGTPAQAPEDLTTPVNVLEETDDANGGWRRYVNQQLADHYQPWFAMLEKLILLKAPNFDAVYRWRGRQEEKLSQSNIQAQHRIMDAQALTRFIQHYQRLTQASLAALPNRADIVFELNDDQQITARRNRQRKMDTKK